MLGKRMHNNTKNGIFGRSSGKGKDILSKTAAARFSKSQLETSDTEASNVTFPYLRPTDNAEHLPCYTSVLARSAEEGISMIELDQLQFELEKLLSASAVRSRLLCSKFELIDTRVEDRHEKKGKCFDKPSSRKHRKIEEKVKHTKETQPAYKLVKNFHDEVPKLESNFWLSVDAYCSPISADDNAFLDDLIEEISKDVDVKISEVGQHYVEDWAIESHQSNGAPRAGKSKSNISSTNGFYPKKNGYHSGESFPNSLILPLASALLEENVNKKTGSQDKLKEIGMKPINNGVCLDKRLRNELSELGILDLDDNQKIGKSQDDEIVQEIKLCHKELCSLNDYNRRELNRLRRSVNKDLARQEVVNKLDEVDNKVMEVYNKLLTATPKERNNIEWEAVRIVQMQKELHKEAMEITDLFL